MPIPSLNAVDVGSESLSATLCPPKAFSEYLMESILTFVEALGHNVVMLHSDQEPVLVQLLKAVQSRRVKRTLVRHGPRASHHSQWSLTRFQVKDDGRTAFVRVLKRVHEPSVAIWTKSDVQVHVRASRQS